MSTCKALLSKITNKNAFYEQEDVTQNIFAFRVVGICILFYSFVMILNCLHILSWIRRFLSEAMWWHVC